MNISISNLKLLLANFSDYDGIFLHGQNFGLTSKIANEIIKKKSENYLIKKLFEVDLEENPDIIRDEFLEPNLFGNNKLLVFYYPSAKTKKEILSYEKYIKDKISILILDEYSKQTDSMRKFFEQEKRMASVICHPTSSADIIQRIKKQFTENSIQYTDEAVKSLSEFTGGDLQILDYELEKIISYTKFREAEVDKELIQKFLSSFGETEYSSVVKNYFDSSVYLFKTSLDKILDQNENIISIIYALQRYVAKLKNVAIHITNKINIQDAMKKEMVFFNEINDFKKNLSELKLKDIFTIERQLFDIEIKAMQFGQDIGRNLLINSLFNDSKS
jgi:DNA polymerase III delta subunit